MELLFRQRMLSWLDSYDIYDERGRTVYTVKGVVSWGHKLKIYDAHGRQVGMVKEKKLTLLPRFLLYEGGDKVGSLRKKVTMLRPRFKLDFRNWDIDGDVWEWNWRIEDGRGDTVMRAHKKLLSFTDTYVMDIRDPRDALHCLMVVLAIDAAQCTAEKREDN